MKIPRPITRVLLTSQDIWQTQLRPLFDLKSDLDEPGTVESIEKSVEFKGVGVWILIFAILIASIGLNVNSTAVIIGAMLISPLMGPIVAVGLALGINNFDLLKRALRNLFIATAVSIIASFLYFSISPVPEAQSELLARTQPTIYDVLIALLGGATGIITGTRKERALHAISGVAIATALMPPLCTAGFGLANRHVGYFLGAMYLFSINSIFICMATFVVVRMLRFKKSTFLDLRTERRVNLYMTVFAVVVTIPSIYTAYQTIDYAIFRAQANKFLTESFVFSQTKILEKRIQRLKDKKIIELTLIGKALEPAEKANLQSRLEMYDLGGTVLAINEASSGSMAEMEAKLGQSLKEQLMERLYRDNQILIKDKDEKIRVLEDELVKYKQIEQLAGDVGPEIHSLSAKVESVSVSHMISWKNQSETTQPVTVALIGWRGRSSKGDRDLVERFVKARLKDDKCEIVHRTK